MSKSFKYYSPNERKVYRNAKAETGRGRGKVIKGKGNYFMDRNGYYDWQVHDWSDGRNMVQVLDDLNQKGIKWRLGTSGRGQKY